MPIDFDDMTTRIIDKLDILDDKIDKICEWKTEMSVEWNNHKKEIDDETKAKTRRFYYLIGLMGIGFTVFELIKEAVL